MTLYLVATAWEDRTAKRWKCRRVRVGAGLARACGRLIICAVERSQRGTKDGYSALKYGVFGLVALFAGAGDLRLLLRGRLWSAHGRLRDIWRMASVLIAAIFSSRGARGCSRWDCEPTSVRAVV